jgi:glycine cleavage system protein P-like pyridoxal-binding family
MYLLSVLPNTANVFEAVITIVFRLLHNVLGHIYFGMAGGNPATSGCMLRISYINTNHA